MRDVLTLIVLLSFVTYRVTRFALEDSMLARQRIWLQAHILGIRTKDDRILKDAYELAQDQDDPEIAGWRLKLYELSDCPFCFGVWVSAGAVALTDWQVSVPLPVWVWLAGSTGSLIIWRWVEG